jgi:TetR/AcrR family transcriptional regulator, cholesterol catabolism regulator
VGEARARWTVRATVDERRDEILKSLAAILRERRLASLTMQDIAARLGLVKGNLYYYFKNKQDILYHCHVKCMDESLAALAVAERDPGPTPERLRTLLVRHIRGIIESPYGGVLLTDLESLSAAQRKRYVSLRDEFERGVRKLIQRGIAKREFRPCNPRLAGFAILGAINWIPKWYQPEGLLAPEEIAQGFADQLIRSLEQ